MHQSLMSSDFFCEVRPHRERVVVDLVGEFDVAVATRVAEVIEDLFDVGFADIVIDLRDLSFIDSAGVHSLISANRSAGLRGASLSLFRGPRDVHRVLTLTSTDSLFAFENDGAEA
jgi:anti-sigma B factor antagonist